MKRLCAACLALLVSLSMTACSSSGDGDNSEPELTGEATGDISQWSDQILLAGLPLNRAVERIPEFNGVESGNCLLAVKHYGDQIGWVEVNQIEGLERLDHTAEGGYFLLVPRVVGSRLTVEALGGGGEELLYEVAETGDDYALIVNSLTPDQPELRVRVECEAGEAVFTFTPAEITPTGSGALPLTANRTYYTEPGHPADMSRMELQTGGAVLGVMAADSGETVYFTVTLPDDCALGASDGTRQTLLWRGTEFHLESLAAAGEEDLGRALGSGHDPIPVEADRPLVKTDSRADDPAYAFLWEDLAVVIRLPWTVPELDGEWDALAVALADSFAVVERAVR